ncbi:DUF7146 domain-containing protein [Bartonella koehlerae]|uniref:DUF7146 domain-containing protein n=1 Tax=Bartonella koehlerae TaxID=92181 RepID=UPI00068C1CA6|nr:hypothetical protein [Bartonella koehlerae]
MIKQKKFGKQSQPIKDKSAEAYFAYAGITCELPPHLRFHDKCHHSLGITPPALVALVKD